jgi:hypothetical protein
MASVKSRLDDTPFLDPDMDIEGDEIAIDTSNGSAANTRIPPLTHPDASDTESTSVEEQQQQPKSSVVISVQQLSPFPEFPRTPPSSSSSSALPLDAVGMDELVSRLPTVPFCRDNMKRAVQGINVKVVPRLEKQKATSSTTKNIKALQRWASTLEGVGDAVVVAAAKTTPAAAAAIEHDSASSDKETLARKQQRRIYLGHAKASVLRETTTNLRDGFMRQMVKAMLGLGIPSAVIAYEPMRGGRTVTMAHESCNWFKENALDAISMAREQVRISGRPKLGRGNNNNNKTGRGNDISGQPPALPTDGDISHQKIDEMVESLLRTIRDEQNGDTVSSSSSSLSSSSSMGSIDSGAGSPLVPESPPMKSAMMTDESIMSFLSSMTIGELLQYFVTWYTTSLQKEFERNFVYEDKNRNHRDNEVGSNEKSKSSKSGGHKKSSKLTSSSESHLSPSIPKVPCLQTTGEKEKEKAKKRKRNASNKQ